MIILHAIECECQECLDKWKKIESIEKKIGGKKKKPALGEKTKKPKDRRKNEKDTGKITEISPLPNHVEAWARCRLLHSKRPILTGKKIFIESIQEWREEIIWVCDHCDIKPSEHNDIMT